MICKTREKLGPRSMLDLLAVPKVSEYYPKIGFTKHDNAWILPAAQPFPASPQRALFLSPASLF
jgi:hypothetical protein